MRTTELRKTVKVPRRMRISATVKAAKMIVALPHDELGLLADGIVPQRLRRVLTSNQDYLSDLAAELYAGGAELRDAAQKILCGRGGLAAWLMNDKGLPPALDFLNNLVHQIGGAA